MTKAEQLAEQEYRMFAPDARRKGGFIDGYNLRDQTAQSEKEEYAVKSAEWCMYETSHAQGTFNKRKYKDVEYTTTDLLKIFNELNKGE